MRKALHYYRGESRFGADWGLAVRGIDRICPQNLWRRDTHTERERVRERDREREWVGIGRRALGTSHTQEMDTKENLALSLSCSLLSSPPLARFLSPSPPYTHTHTHALCLSLTHFPSLPLSLCFSLSLTTFCRLSYIQKFPTPSPIPLCKRRRFVSSSVRNTHKKKRRGEDREV